jgi:hypothetical protein
VVDKVDAPTPCIGLPIWICRLCRSRAKRKKPFFSLLSLLARIFDSLSAYARASDKVDKHPGRPAAPGRLPQCRTQESADMTDARKGMRVDIYRPADHATAAGGVSERFDRLTLTGPGVPEMVEPTEECPEVTLQPPGPHCDVYRAFTTEPQPEGARGPQFGGAFVFGYGGRLPFSYPIRLMDRFEPIV